MRDYLLDKFKFSLYIILDPHFIGQRDLLRTCLDIITGGVDIIQYRDKSASDKKFFKNTRLIYDITKDNNIPLIVNDRIHIASEIGTEGVHLGASDISLTEARKIFGKDKIIGFSVHNMDEFNSSQEADYLGIGSIFPSKTKKSVNVCGLEFLKRIRKKTSKPLIGIGGINSGNFLDVINNGADGIALISSIFTSTNVVTKVKEFSRRLNKRRSSND